MITEEPTNSNWNKVYATVTDRNGDPVRIGAAIHKVGDTDGYEVVTIWKVRGGILGGIQLKSLKDSKLSAKNLQDYFDSFNVGG